MKVTLLFLFGLFIISCAQQPNFDTTYFVSIDGSDTIFIDGAGVYSVDTLELGGVKYTSLSSTPSGSLDLSWADNNGVAFESNDTLDISSNNYITSDNLYATGNLYYDASGNYYSTAGGAYNFYSNGTPTLQFGAVINKIRSPSGTDEILLIDNDLRLNSDQIYMGGSGTSSGNVVTIGHLVGRNKNLLGFIRAGEGSADVFIDTNGVFQSDTGIVADYIEADSIGFPDGTWQTTAATGGGGGSVDLSAAPSGAVLYEDGDTISYDSDMTYNSSGLTIGDTIFVDDISNNEGTDITFNNSTEFLNTIYVGDRSDDITIQNLSGQLRIGGNTTVTEIYSNNNRHFRGDASTTTFYSPANSSNFMNANSSGVRLDTDVSDRVAIGDYYGSSSISIRRDKNYKNILAIYEPATSNSYWSIDTNGVVTQDTALIVNDYIEADSIVLLNNTYSDFVFEDDYELMTLQEQLQYAKKHKHLKGMDRDGYTNPITYINDLEMKLEESYLYLEQLQTRIEKLEQGNKNNLIPGIILGLALFIMFLVWIFKAKFE
jgi:hypothetical protein